MLPYKYIYVYVYITILCVNKHKTALVNLFYSDRPTMKFSYNNEKIIFYRLYRIKDIYEAIDTVRIENYIKIKRFL